MYWYSRHCCSITWGCPSAKVCLSTIQGIYSQFTGGSISQNRFVCQFWCTGIQGIAALLPGGVHLPKYVCLPLKASILDSLGGPLAKVGSSLNFGILVFKASLLYSLGVHLPKYVHLPSFVYQYSRLYALLMGSPSAKEGSSAKYEHTSKFTLASQKVFLYILYERPNNFWCNYLQEILSHFVGGPLAKVG